MTTKVNANPEMIKWARENAGFTLDELPKSLKNAEKWESGEEKPTWSDLRKLAQKYKRPSFFYFLKTPPIEEDNFIEFRSDEKIEEFSSSLRLEIRKAKARRNAYLKIHKLMNIEIPNFKKYTSTEKNPYKLAKHIRNFLNINYETQQKWITNENNKKDYTHNNFLKKWKEICFDLGILVFEFEKVPENEISGCSIYYDFCPIILINGKNSHNRRIFTLMHELAHLTQKISAICDIDKHNEKETFCNKVASEILIPKKTLEKNQILSKNGNVKLGTISHKYGTSKETVIYKLNSCHLINNKTKNKLLLEINNKTSKKNKTIPKISTSTKKKKYDGTPYTKLVLNAYDNKIITTTQAMRYLDTSYENFEKINTELMG